MAPSVPDKIPCHTAKDLRYALDPLRPLIEQPETEENWEKISRAIQTIAALTRGGAADIESDYVKEIRSFSGLILNSMNSERTRLANIAVDLFTILAPPLGSKFESLIGVFVPNLIRLLGRTNKVFIARATAGLHAIITHCPHPRLLVELRVMVTDKSPALRVLVGGAVLRCMTEWDWSVPSLASKAGDVETVIRAFGTDSNVDARKIARQIFDCYKQTFPDRVESFLEPLTPVIKRYLDIKPKGSRDESGPTARKLAPVPAPRFKAAATAPAPTQPVQQVLECPEEEQPPPKMTRVGLSRSGPTRAPIDPRAQAPPVSVHSRVVSGPARVAAHPARDYALETVAASGPMRAAVPSGHAGHPVMRTVSSSGPSRMRVDPPALPPATSVTVDSQPSSHAQPAAEPTRRFRPVRAPMDPSQMPQRVAVLPPVPKPTVEPRKVDGPSRVQVGTGARSVSGPVTVAPTRVISTSVKTEHELKASTTTPALALLTGESESQLPSSSEPAPASAPVPLSVSTQISSALELKAVTVPIPSPTSVPIPASAPVSRPASVAASHSRPPSVASNVISKAQSDIPLTPTEPPVAPTAPPKPTLTSSKSAPITTKVSALIKRGNPYAPPPFVPKRVPSSGVGASTASQMARQREAIAAREKREAEEAAKKVKREAVQKRDTKANDAKKAGAPAASSRPRPPSSQSGSTRSVPAAPRKQAASIRTKQGVPPKVDVKELEPEMVAAVCAPLPGSPTPPEVNEAPVSPTEKNTANTETMNVEAIVPDEVAEDVDMELVIQEPATIEVTPVEAEAEADLPISTERVAPTHASESDPMVIEVHDSSSEVDMNEEVDNVTDQVGAPPPDEQNVQTPQRQVGVSLIDQTPALPGITPAAAPSTGFAFHPHLAHFMALPPQPIQEPDAFLVDLSSPPPKERPVENEGLSRQILADRGNTHTYLSQFTQDLMTLSGL